MIDIPRSAVPCNGCTACCWNQTVLLYPDSGDDLASYECEPATNPITGLPGWALKHREDGSCVYLGKGGCTIYEHAPAICRNFDCRIALLEMSPDRVTRRRLVRESNDPVLTAGQARMRTLTPADIEARKRLRKQWDLVPAGEAMRFGRRIVPHGPVAETRRRRQRAS